jgi:hypothetical protein
MSNDIKGDHFKLVKDIHQDVEDFIVQTLTKPGLEVGKRAFGGNMVHINAGVGPVSPAFVFVPKILEEPVHVRVLIDVPEQLQQKQRDRIIWRRTFHGIKVSGQGSDKGKIDQRGDHSCKSTLDIPIGKDFDEPFFKPIGRTHHQAGKNNVVGYRDPGIDPVELFTDAVNVKPPERCHLRSAAF